VRAGSHASGRPSHGRDDADAGRGRSHGGDAYGNRSTLVSASNSGTQLYVKSRPKQWALQNVDAECTMEQWITLSGSVATVRNRLTNARADTTQHAARTQELPAVYT